MRVLYFGLALILLTSTASAQNPPAGRPQAQSPLEAASKPLPGPLPSATASMLQTKAQEYLRNLYAWGPEFGLKIGDVKASAIPDLYEINVEVTLNGQSDSAIVYVTKDGRYMVRGEVLDMTSDPFKEIKDKLVLDGWPSIGPKDSSVVIVEFGDFQCPVCRQLDLVLRKILPKFPNVRLVFKDFPLESVHPWAMTAALVGRCAYKEDPDAFWKLHDLIYDNQDQITTDGALGKLLEFSTSVGLNQDSMRACTEDPGTKESVHQSIAEGLDAGVNGTPTSFVNGRTVVGPNEKLFRQYITYTHIE